MWQSFVSGPVVPAIVANREYTLLIPTSTSKLVTTLYLQVLLEFNFPPVGYHLSNGVLTLSLNLTDTVESIRDIPADFVATPFPATVTKFTDKNGIVKYTFRFFLQLPNRIFIGKFHLLDRLLLPFIFYLFTRNNICTYRREKEKERKKE